MSHPNATERLSPSKKHYLPHQRSCKTHARSEMPRSSFARRSSTIVPKAYADANPHDGQALEAGLGLFRKIQESEIDRQRLVRRQSAGTRALVRNLHRTKQCGALGAAVQVGKPPIASFPEYSKGFFYCSLTRGSGAVDRLSFYVASRIFQLY